MKLQEILNKARVSQEATGKGGTTMLQVVHEHPWYTYLTLIAIALATLPLMAMTFAEALGGHAKEPGQDSWTTNGEERAPPIHKYHRPF